MLVAKRHSTALVAVESPTCATDFADHARHLRRLAQHLPDRLILGAVSIEPEVKAKAPQLLLDLQHLEPRQFLVAQHAFDAAADAVNQVKPALREIAPAHRISGRGTP